MPRLPPLDTSVCNPPALPSFDGTAPLSPWLAQARCTISAHPSFFLTEEAQVEFLAVSLRARPRAWYAYHSGLIYLRSLGDFESALRYHFDGSGRIPSSDADRRLALDFAHCHQTPGESVAEYSGRFQSLRKEYARTHLARLERHYGTRTGQREMLAAWYVAGLDGPIRTAVEAECPDAGKVSDVEAAARRVEARLAGTERGAHPAGGKMDKQEKPEARHVSYDNGLGAGGRALRLTARAMPHMASARSHRV